MNAENNEALSWGTVVYPLLFPIEIENHPTVTELVFREPNGEALEAIDEIGILGDKAPTMKQALALIRVLSGQPKIVTDKMNIRDITGASEVIAPLLEAASGNDQ